MPPKKQKKAKKAMVPPKEWARPGFFDWNQRKWVYKAPTSRHSGRREQRLSPAEGRAAAAKEQAKLEAEGRWPPEEQQQQQQQEQVFRVKKEEIETDDDVDDDATVQYESEDPVLDIGDSGPLVFIDQLPDDDEEDMTPQFYSIEDAIEDRDAARAQLRECQEVLRRLLAQQASGRGGMMERARQLDLRPSDPGRNAFDEWDDQVAQLAAEIGVDLSRPWVRAAINASQGNIHSLAAMFEQGKKRGGQFIRGG